MAPVSAGDFLDAIAAQQGLTPALLDALADTVSAYHRTLPPVPGVDWPEAMRTIAQGNAIAAHDAGLSDDRVRPGSRQSPHELRRLPPGSPRAQRMASCAAHTATCTWGTSVSGTAHQCRSTRSSSMRQWRPSTLATTWRSC